MAMVIVALALLASGLSQHVEAEQQQHWQGYDIHYTTFPSTLIPADIARLHNITRATNRVVTNISVRKNSGPVKVKITGLVNNLLNQQYKLEFEEITEQDAVYYLASQIVDEKDTLRFSISIQPPNTEAYLLEFVRQYY